MFEVTFQVKDDSLGLVEWKVWIDISGGELETVQRYGACWIVKWLSNRLEILVLIFFKKTSKDYLKKIRIVLSSFPTPSLPFLFPFVLKCGMEFPELCYVAKNVEPLLSFFLNIKLETLWDWTFSWVSCYFQALAKQIFKVDLEKGEEPKIKLPTSFGSLKSKRIPEKHLLLPHWLC